jgi:hypothetical protein
MAPDIVNNSWGGGDTTFYQDIVEAWNAAGIFEAFAAGNDGDGTTCSTTHAPGSQAPSYGVGAYDVNGRIAGFSGFGPSLVDGSAKPNISAPGVKVASGHRALRLAEHTGDPTAVAFERANLAELHLLLREFREGGNMRRRRYGRRAGKPRGAPRTPWPRWPGSGSAPVSRTRRSC